MPTVPPTLSVGVIDRVVAIFSDALVCGIILIAVQLGALDRNSGIVMVGYALRALVAPSTTLSAVSTSLGTTVGALIKNGKNGNGNGGTSS